MAHRPNRFAVLVLLALASSGISSGVPGAGQPTDAELERFLVDAKVVDIVDIGSGITKPKKLTLELDGVTRKAAFKYEHIEKVGLTRFASAPTELNFTDSYRFERAAYLLDRKLGIDMVPVAVIRKVEGREGAVIEWISDAMTEAERLRTGARPPEPGLLVRQQAVMAVFDALIYNVDRNEGNQLITKDDWKLHLIDHSRAFRMWKELPEEFVASPVSLPRDLLAALEGLEQKDLKDRLEGLISGVQIKALLKRRDLILAKVAADREKYGDAMVLQD